MDNLQKKSLRSVYKIPMFQGIIRKLTIDEELTSDEQSYILSCSILFLKHYGLDNRLTSFAEFSYYIILKYCIKYNDFMPLYDFSANFGFYPATEAILRDHMAANKTVNDICLSIEIERFKNGSYIETLQQFVEKNKLLENDDDTDLSFVAPTSFGKSSLIVDFIREHRREDSKIVIVVPTKSLLMQTYRMIRNEELGMKIIIHDEMFQNDNSFIAVFTQERALRLLAKQKIAFDLLFIDEAHNVLKDDARSVLLSRLLAKNRLLNSNQKVIYLSPLLDDVSNLRFHTDQVIKAFKIPFNIKEPEIFELRSNGQIFKYNRFIGDHYFIDLAQNKFEYIKRSALRKNFIYNYRPIEIERFARELSSSLPRLEQTKELSDLINILKIEVHEGFYVIDHLEFGVVYLHGKLPDIIKEYLESKFSEIAQIRFVIANSVILEGMNLPIDNLFIVNTRSLYGKELTNLIGRVNRLNMIFGKDRSDLRKLLPPVHFINSDYNGRDSKMTHKIELLRGRVFKDVVENPTLQAFNFDLLKIPKKDKETKRQKYELIQRNELFLSSAKDTDSKKIKQYVIENGISDFYSNVDGLVTILFDRLIAIRSRLDWSGRTMMEKIYDVFLNDIEYVNDFEFSRLSYSPARDYYEFHIRVGQKRSLNENINHMVTHFKRRVEAGNGITYFGKSYGEIENPVVTVGKRSRTFVDLADKSESQLVNLAIVKIKMEDDFISFKLNKFIVALYDFNLISLEDYNLYVYGTTDQNVIELTKIGLSVGLISRLRNDGQLEFLFFDEFNNLKARPEFNAYLNSISDFHRFEIKRFLS